MGPTLTSQGPDENLWSEDLTSWVLVQRPHICGNFLILTYFLYQYKNDSMILLMLIRTD
jgi:hypothetical protein